MCQVVKGLGEGDVLYHAFVKKVSSTPVQVYILEERQMA